MNIGHVSLFGLNHRNFVSHKENIKSELNILSMIGDSSCFVKRIGCWTILYLIIRNVPDVFNEDSKGKQIKNYILTLLLILSF